MMHRKAETQLSEVQVQVVGTVYILILQMRKIEAQRGLNDSVQLKTADK